MTVRTAIFSGRGPFAAAQWLGPDRCFGLLQKKKKPRTVSKRSWRLPLDIVTWNEFQAAWRSPKYVTNVTITDFDGNPKEVIKTVHAAAAHNPNDTTAGNATSARFHKPSLMILHDATGTSTSSLVMAGTAASWVVTRYCPNASVTTWNALELEVATLSLLRCTSNK